MSSLHPKVFKAMLFAIKAHGDQKRKYSGEPYVYHLVEVLGLVAEVEPNDVELHCAAVLHDVLEDTSVKSQELDSEFGHDVSNLVIQVTDVSSLQDGNRKYRKMLDREHLALASARAKIIKLADLLSNTKSIVENDLKFAAVYLEEVRQLLPFLVEGDQTLFVRATAQLAAGLNILKEKGHVTYHR